ncbi:MAG: serine--tRNA ligase [Nanopusillaceae archaeon]
MVKKYIESFRDRGLDESKVYIAIELNKKRKELQKILDEKRAIKNKLSKIYGILQAFKHNKIDKESLEKELNKFGLKYKEDIEKEITKKIEEIDKEIENVEKEYNKVLDEFIRLTWTFPNILHPDVPKGDDKYNKPLYYWGVVRVIDENAFQKEVSQDGKYNWKIIELSNIPEKYIKDKEKLRELYKILKGEEDFYYINYDDVLDFDLLNKDRLVPYVKIDWEPLHHYDLIDKFKLAETSKASEVSGSRFYFEFDIFALLDLALSLEGLKFLEKRGYKITITPYLLRKHVLDGIITLDDYEDMMYKIENEDLYLIGTAEHSITALYYDSIIEEKDLPIKMAGWSACFRKEAGAHGKDTKGLFRVHQFHKVEQYIFCKPEDSERYHEELIQNQMDFFKLLNIPHRKILIASKDMGKRNYKQYDVEGWFPGQQKYRELGSGSNVTDWQARRCNIRYRTKNNELEFVHTLNCTLVAVQRTLLCLLENNYDRKNIKLFIPEILTKYFK